MSKEQILENIEGENFNSLKYMKSDYMNFKNYLNTTSYPKHVDYLNSDYAPNLLKFMKIKIVGKKTESYYNFLKGIEEQGLPLVRRHEYVIVEQLLNGYKSKDYLKTIMSSEIPNFEDEQMEHALRFLMENEAVLIDENIVSLACEIEGICRVYKRSNQLWYYRF